MAPDRPIFVASQARTARGAAILLFVGVVALMAVVVATHVLGSRAQRSFDSVLLARHLSSTVDQLRYAVQSAEASQRGYVATGNQIYLAPYSTTRAEATRRAADLREALADRTDVAPALARLGELVVEKFDEMDQTIALKRQGRDAEALAQVQTNRGKAMTDEANLFLSRFVRIADGQLTAASEAQRHWLSLLRAINLVAALLVLVVVAAVVWNIWHFAQNLARARSEVESLNVDLERRVVERTAELAAARDRAELLMADVNHRVANSLTIVASMVKLQARSADPTAKKLLSEVHDRVLAVAMVHRRLYSSGDVRSVELDDFLGSMLDEMATMMKDTGHDGRLMHKIAPMTVPTDKSVSLGVITAELVTNAYKYAYPVTPGEIRVRLEHSEGSSAILTVEDDGIGRTAEATPRGTGLGSRLVSAMAASLGGQIEYMERGQGTAARVSFPI